MESDDRSDWVPSSHQSELGIKKSFGKKTSSKNFKSVRTSGMPEMRRKGGEARTAGAFTKDIPSGKWKRDLYSDLDAPETDSSGKWKNDLFAAHDSTKGPLDSSVNADKKVRVNISNLAPTVTTSDLKELFFPYSVDSSFVHYGQNKVHLGTGEVTMKKNDAERALKELDGVVIDGSLLTMTIVGGGSIFDRVQMVKKVDGGRIQKRSVKPHNVRPAKNSNGARHPLDRSDENTKINGGKGDKKTKKLTEEDLDAELDSYMKK